MTTWDTLPKGYRECANEGCTKVFRQYRTTDRDCSRTCYQERTKAKRSKRNQLKAQAAAQANPYQEMTLPQQQLAVAQGLQGHVESGDHSKFGWIEFGPRRLYMRSSWERNYARYLEFVKQHGDIKDKTVRQNNKRAKALEAVEKMKKEHGLC